MRRIIVILISVLIFSIADVSADTTTPYATYTTTISEKNHIYISFQREEFKIGTLTLIINNQVFRKTAENENISGLEFLYFLLKGLFQNERLIEN